MTRIVFLEDDILVGSLITKALEEKGFEVTFTNNLDVLKSTIRNVRPNVLLLDLKIGNKNSLEEIPFIRSEFPSLPIIIASSHHDSKEMVSCYEAGAKFYLIKPYEADEVERMIRMALPLSTQNVLDYIYFGQFQLNLTKHTLQYADESIKELNPKEFHLLKLLLTHKNKPVSRQIILQEVWQNEEAGSSLNNYINYLRKYLEKDQNISLVTIKGIGYSIQEVKNT
ncbi:response regulator transcription factor [Parabacteroides distasonis]|uniref:Response regulator transcription factor n=1 Tax=Parabacteroides distasonis TaxID=823 RepID=A0A4S2EJR9_PARDI|nr:response regulator transcription factor [Parabacteroides distasonis]TGY55975.1 response regulator transcription factor [Parabacteroides distasonis]